MTTLAISISRSIPVARTCVVAVTFLLLLFVFPSWVLAQGKLGRIRKAVRKVEAVADRPSKKPEPKTQTKVAEARKEARGNPRPDRNERSRGRFPPDACPFPGTSFF